MQQLLDLLQIQIPIAFPRNHLSPAICMAMATFGFGHYPGVRKKLHIHNTHEPCFRSLLRS